MKHNLRVPKHAVASVPYINARPLVRWFAETQAVDVAYDVPSRLPALLDNGSAEAVLASAFEALSTPGRTYAEGVSIASYAAVESVRLFSKVPFGEITSLALDASSLTSNALAQVLLIELFGVRPVCTEALPSLDEMLQTNDAAVLIGDKGMAASALGLHVLDLGWAWNRLTGLPFVWALWIGNESLSPELVRLLQQAARWGEKQTDLIAKEAAEQTGISYGACHRYLAETMNYELTGRHIEGMTLYRDLLVKHGLVKQALFPVPVNSEL